MKKILFVVCTHGNEVAGLDLFLKHPYGRTSHVEWEVVIGNPKALSLNSRFIDTDLNRIGLSYKKLSNSYEVERTALLEQKMSGYDVIYDIHTTSSILDEVNDCVFVNNLDSIPDTYFALAEHVIHDVKDNQKYVTSLHKNGITLEYIKTATVENDRARIKADFERIIHQKKASKKKILSEFYCLISQEKSKKYNLRWENLQPITDEDVVALNLPTGTYYPMFVNSVQNDKQVYAALNIKR